MIKKKGFSTEMGERLSPTWMTDSWNAPLQRTSISIPDATLVVLEGPYQGMSIELGQEILHIGRADWCDISLDKDRKVSKHHCEVHVDTSGIWVRDLGSRNGTFVGGVRCVEAYLSPEHPLKVGHSLFALRTEAPQKELEISYVDGSGQLVGQSDAMRELFSLLRRLAPRDACVLLLGETGTGKSSVARALHDQSTRHKGPFVSINCGSLSPSLIEASLFGYEKGAFTDANQMRKGVFEQAQGGTLFLDEIGELPLDLQPKLLDVVERNAVRRLGGEGEISLDFRLIVATHRDLLQEVQMGQFREDLYYRLAVVELELPPLRERTEDLPLLVDHLLGQLCPSGQPQLSPGAIAALQACLWPGNVRQLRNTLERSLIFLEGDILPQEDLMLPRDTEAPSRRYGESSIKKRSLPEKSAATESPEDPMSLKERLEVEEKKIVEEVLERFRGDIRKASDVLNVSKSWLYGRINRYGLRSAEAEGEET